MEQRSKEHIINLEIYTDGSCKKLGNNFLFGGWSFIATRDNKEIFRASDGVVDTTNQRMELLAIRNALEYAEKNRSNNEKVIIYSDSAYAINCYLQDWYQKWLVNGWKNGQKQPVANRDLWEDIIPYFGSFWYDFRKVDGHSGIYWNERCDELAQNEASKLKTTWRGYKDD